MHKHNQSWFLAWAAGILLTGFAVAYIVRNAQSMDAAVVEIFGTLIGTMVGVMGGLYYDRYKQGNQEDANLTVLESVLREELVHNGTALIQLNDALGRSEAARADIWQLGRIIVDAIDTSTYRQWLQLAVARPQRGTFESVSIAYRNLIRLQHRVQQAGAWHAFYFGYSADENAANAQMDDVRKSVAIVRLQLEHALKDLPNKG